MKKTLIVLLLLALVASSCNNYFVAKRDPSVLNSSILLSGEVTGDVYPEFRTMRMRASGQASNFLLLEIYGMESFSDTRSLEVNDSLAGNQLYLSLVDDGTPGTEHCYRNVQFWVGPFEKDQYYTIHLRESNAATFQDTLSLSFEYQQSFDETVNSDSYGYWISDMPLGTYGYAPYFSSADLPDSLAKYKEYEPDSIYFEEMGDSLRVVSIFSATCSIALFEAYAEIECDTLKMYAWSSQIPTNACETQYYFFYEFNNYVEQVFYYKFDFNISTMFEGSYNLP